MIPPHRGPTFLLEFFDTRDFSKKSVFGQRLGWGTAKNERILEKSQTYMVRVFFLNQKSPFFQWGFWAFWTKMVIFGPQKPQNRQKWAKMDKIVQKRIFRMK